MDTWFIQALNNTGDIEQRVCLRQFPFHIGRSKEANLRLESNEVSRIHATFELDDGCLVISDCGSLNGTAVNNEKITGKTPLSHDTKVTVGNKSFRVIKPALSAVQTEPASVNGANHDNLAEHLKSLIREARINTVFQPIFTVGETTPSAYEVLSRGAHPTLSQAPSDLFEIAEPLSLEVKLSHLMRQRTIEDADNSGSHCHFFLNMHPQELSDPITLFSSLRDLRLLHPNVNLVLELHQSAVANDTLYKQIRLQLKQLDIQVAFDNFGTGQSRLIELTQNPPDYIKFSSSLFDDVATKPEENLDVIKVLLKLSKQYGIKTIAEGIDTEERALICKELGFDCLQGFYLGCPRPHDYAHENFVFKDKCLP